MPTPNPDEFWTLLAESKLGETAALGKLRREFEGLPFPPALRQRRPPSWWPGGS